MKKAFLPQMNFFEQEGLYKERRSYRRYLHHLFLMTIITPQTTTVTKN